MNIINRYKVVVVNNLIIVVCKIWKLIFGYNIFDSCWVNSLSFCCNGVFFLLVLIILFRILFVNWLIIFLKCYWRDDIKKNYNIK